MTVAVMVLGTGRVLPAQQPGPTERAPADPALAAPGPRPAVYTNPNPLGADPRVLRLSLAAFSEFHDHFRLQEDPFASELRTGVALGVDYRKIGEKRRVSLGSSFSVSRDLRAERWNLGYGTLVGAISRDDPRRSFRLSDTLRYGDDPIEASDTLSAGNREPYFENSFSPAWTFRLRERTNLNLAYRNSMVWGTEETIESSMTHGVALGVERQLSETWSGSLGYDFRLVDRAASEELTHALLGNLSGDLDARSSLDFDLSGWVYGGERGRVREDWRVAGRARVSRVLVEGLAVAAGGGVEALGLPDGSVRYKPIWIAGLDGSLGLPMFNSDRTTLRLSGGQSVRDTSGEVRDRGLLLDLNARLDFQHLLGPRTPLRLWGRYQRSRTLFGTGSDPDLELELDETIQGGGSLGAPLGQFWFVSLDYRYVHRLNERPDEPPEENRIGFAIGRSFYFF